MSLTSTMGWSTAAPGGGLLCKPLRAGRVFAVWSICLLGPRCIAGEESRDERETEMESPTEWHWGEKLLLPQSAGVSFCCRCLVDLLTQREIAAVFPRVETAADFGFLLLESI